MVALAAVVAGDVHVTRTRTLTEFGSLDDGTGDPGVADVVAHIWRGDTDPVALTVVVDDAEGCEFTIEFGDDEGWLASRPTSGVWLIEYQATFEDGTVITAPAVWPDEITVRSDNDPEA